MVCSFPMPLITYFDFKSMRIGFPLSLTEWWRRSIEENADWRPYHCAANLSRPSAIVRGSVNVASSRQRASFASEGRPAKRSRTDPMRVCCCSVRETPGAVWIFLVSMLRSGEMFGIPIQRSKDFTTTSGQRRGGTCRHFCCGCLRGASKLYECRLC